MLNKLLEYMKTVLLRRVLVQLVIRFSISTFLVGVSLESAAVDDVSNRDVDRGYELATETDKRDSGFGDILATGVIINKSASGDVNQKVFEMITVEVEDDGDRRFVKVSEPSSLRGTMFLSHAHALKSDDVWVMLPRTSRMRRVATQDKTGRFLSSELTLEDISPWEIEKYSYRYIKDDKCGQGSANNCHVIENTPAYRFSGYTRQIEYLDSDILQPRKIEYYGLNGELMKYLEFSQYKQVGLRYWRPMFMKMTNVVTGAVSEIHWDDYKVSTGYKAKDLSPTNLARLSR